jgi:hypothetical protein
MKREGGLTHPSEADRQDKTMSAEFHVVLLGDSIFDNRAYTGGDPDVIAHLRALLPSGWQASLVAGELVESQIARHNSLFD